MNLLELYDYFASLPPLVQGLDTFVQGDADEIIAAERNGSLNDVTLWVETPTSIIDDEDDGTWIVRVLVLKKATPKTLELTQQTHHLTHTVARRVIARLRHDDDNGDVQVGKSKVKLQPAYVGSSGLAGWYFDLQIVADDECVTASEIGAG